MVQLQRVEIGPRIQNAPTEFDGRGVVYYKYCAPPALSGVDGDEDFGGVSGLREQAVILDCEGAPTSGRRLIKLRN
jgi:hypothetical protein